MSLEIKEVTGKKLLRAFVHFPLNLYKDNPYFVPPLFFDEMNTLSKSKNPAFDHCEARYWLAYKNNKVVGRIAGILNRSYIEKWNNRYMRFGWIDFEEDEEIANALMAAVENWARETGMTAVHGPLGFTDLDYEGMLVEGFDQVGTLATIYNYSYYPVIMEKMGYKKDSDWVEYKIRVHDTIPVKMEKMAGIVTKRYGLAVVKTRKPKDILPYAKQVFELINSAYADLYGVVHLTEKQIQYYTKQYFSFIRPEFVPLITDKKGKLVAMGIAMPSLSAALQKTKGNLFPLGFIHILRAMKKNNKADLMLVAVDKAYQGKGLNAILILEMNKAFIRRGIKFAESNPELELNTKVQSFWEHFDAVQHKRRRCYIKNLAT